VKRLKVFGLGIVAVVVLAVMAGIWAVWFAPPPIDVITAGPAVRIDTRYMGEYFVAAALIEVTERDGSPVLRATSSKSRCKSDLFVFVGGANTVPALSTSSCAVEVPRHSTTFDLKAGEGYTFTVIADNLFGHPRRASRSFTVPATEEELRAPDPTSVPDVDFSSPRSSRI
jgi:hypothetical protein